MSAESPRHARSGGPLTVPSQPPSDRSIIDAVSGFINDVTLSSSSTVDPKDVIQWARFETADINEPTPEGDSDNDISPLLLILGYGSGVQVWLIPPTGEAQEVLSWRQGTVRVLRILPTPQHGDCFASKRPLIALCDSVSPGPTYCSLSFISIRGGEQVKSIKFKNPILDVLANKRSVVVAFSERFAVFDAGTLEDRLAVTTCYPCPCPLGGNAPVNPLALGDRWLAYADKKLNQSKRSSGGCEGEGVSSYTATVLHAAKSLSKGLRGLGESVAHSLAGGRTASQSPSPPNTDVQQPGVVTVLDIEGNDEETQDSEEPYDPIVAHFVAHSEAIIALQFDASGMLLVTADRRGHDFHVFRINPHPCGPSLASVHHLYILHRGDTTAKVQDIALSGDSRWAAVSTLRGTTHLFPLSPYGGACGVRTHTSPRVVNRLSRFHRSAGLPIHAAAHKHQAGSPVSDSVSQGAWFPNPRLPPYPLPASLSPLAQLRPTANLPTHTITRNSSGRQRLSSLSEECSQAPLLARARFGPAPIGGSGGQARAPAAAALYLVAASGCLSHIALHPRPARNVPKEKICDESPIELEVEPIAQWPLQRPAAASDLLAPLPPSNPLLQPMSCRRCADMCMSEEERWLSQVEIVTHAGPHRRLWMGPQFVFKTYNCTGSNSSLSEAETVEVETSASRSVARSNPVNMPGVRPVVPVLIDSGSASSLEHSPSDSFRRKSLLAETGRAASVCDVQLKEDLAEAMKEDHGWRESERGWDTRRAVSTTAAACVERVVDPLGTVVAPLPATSAPPLDDPDSYTTSNSDEATFRPVVRAPAALSLHPDMVVRPLPRNTTIPVQTVSPMATMSPQDEPLPLNTDVVIPAALTTVEGWHSSNQIDDDPDEVPNSSIDIPKVKISTEIEEARSKEKVKQKEFVPDDNPDVDVTKKYKSTEKVAEEKHVEAIVKAPDIQKTSTKQDETSNDNKQSATVKEGVEKDYEDKIEKQDEQKDKAAKTGKPLSKKVVREEPGVKTMELDNRVVTDVASIVDRIIIDDKKTDVNKDLKRQESDVRKRDSARERSSVECTEQKSEDSKSLPKSNRPSDDIQPTAKNRVKKSPTPKSVSDKDSEVSVKDNKFNKIDEAKVIKDLKEVKETKEVKEPKEPKEIKKQKADRAPKGVKEISEPKEFQIKHDNPDKEMAQVLQIIDKPLQATKNSEIHSEILKVNKTELIDYTIDDQSFGVSIKLPTKKELTETKAKKSDEYDIKTEDQAWDMLLSEPEKPLLLNVSQESGSSSDKGSEEKSKSKRNRKLKKSQDDNQSKSEEDSFVEIHAIEEKLQPCSDELVSISIPFEEINCSTSYSSKTKKTRSPKCSTPEKRDECEKQSIDIISHEELECYKPKNMKKYDDISDIELSEPLMFSNTHKAKKHSDGTASECTSYKEFVKPNKSKSLSPYPEMRKLSEKPIDMADKDVYVINTTDDDFPEIQITKCSKPRKKSPQPEKKVVEKEPVIEKPVKSWSSIAAGKSVKQIGDFKVLERKSDVSCKRSELKGDAIASDDNPVSSTTVSLQDKLIELCKRTDIMVAECDAPAELNFVEEHHGAVPDLPPLEPLDFGLDDFKLEVMRDSLLDVNETNLTSPICKINIDDILSSIKETTNKVIESSTFNLIDLEKAPVKKDRGFSVIETDKITSQEIKIDDDKLDDKDMEKSSDDDVTSSPVVSTDSDKEEKKNAGASNLVLPSSKQSAKSKKSRRKKK